MQQALRCLFVGIAFVLALLAGTPLLAQAPYVDDRYPHLFAPRNQAPRIISIPESTRPAPRPARPADPIRPPRERPGHGARAPGAEAHAAPTTFVLVLGDNLAEWLAYGLQEAFEDVPELGVVDRTRLSSGLARPETQDWTQAIPEILARQGKVDFIVMMLGAHDRQPIRLEGESLDAESEKWKEIYAQRVAQAMQAMRARGVPVYWVGVPPLRGQRLSAHMTMLNEIYKEQAQKNGVAYVDVWNGFVDEHGNYTQFGPDFAGQVRRLRTADGVHFTLAGARKLALFLERELRRDLLGRITPALPEAPSDPGQPHPPEAGDMPAPLAPRPVAGPVLVLHGIPAGPAALPPSEAPPPVAELAGAAPARPLSGVAASVLVRGEAPPPVAGRIDDFRWPRAAQQAPGPAPGPAAARP